MKRQEILLEVISNMERKKWGKVESRLTDDFTFNGFLPEPVFKEEWINVIRSLRQGIPDLKLTINHIITKGNKLIGILEIKGTHTKKIPSPEAGLKSIPPTGRKIELQPEVLEVSFEDDCISDLTLMPVESDQAIEDIFAMHIR